MYLAVAVALPAAVIRRVRALSDDSSEDPKKVSISIAYRVAAELGVGVEDAQEAISNLVTGREFSFMTAGLSSQYLWFEAQAPTNTLHLI